MFSKVNPKRKNNIIKVAALLVTLIFISGVIISLALILKKDKSGERNSPPTEIQKVNPDVDKRKKKKDTVDISDENTAKFEHFPAKYIKTGWTTTLNASPKWKEFVNKGNDHKDNIEETGTTTVAYKNYVEDKSKSIGIMIAANSGKPAGGCGGDCIQSIHAGHTTQEEDIVSNWLITECAKVSKANQKECMDKIFKETIYKKWGMKNPHDTDHETIQGTDYTKIKTKDEAWKYGDTWYLKGAHLSAKVIDKDLSENEQNSYNIDEQFPCDFVFVAGPNASKPKKSKDDSSSMKRTYNQAANDINNYDLFREGVKAAIRGGLEAMRKNKINLAYVAGISTGLYAGPHKKRINENKEFESIVNEICNEEMNDTKTQRCDAFDDVIYVKLE